MRVVVIGLGSMGKRRIRLMQQIDPQIEILGLDSREDRRTEVMAKFGIDTCADLSDVWNRNVDCAFICTSPLSHGALIEDCLKHDLHVFTEINLVADNYDTNMKLAEAHHKVLFLSSTFLYRDEIHYIKQAVERADSLLTYHYHIGQYLPDWHPWENYTDYFIGSPRTNGCREIMAIDFPWIYKTFGPVKDFSVKKNKKTGLKTTYCDSYLILLEHENGIQGTVCVDVVSRKAVRNLEIYGEDLYLTWDGSAKGLKEYQIDTREEHTVSLYDTVDQQAGYAAFVVENAYRKEIESFFAQIAGKFTPTYQFEDDKYVLALIDKIENG